MSHTIKKHYDIIASSKKKRTQSPILLLRNYNNRVKEFLLKSYDTTTTNNVIDFASGKGGDLWKMVKYFKYLLSIDVSYASTREAKNRYTNNTQLHNLNATFLTGDISNKKLFEDISRDISYQNFFDTATCFMAIHYLFINRHTINNFIDNIHYALKTNGTVIIATVDNTEIVKRENWTTKYSNVQFLNKKKTDFGYGYKFTLHGVVENLPEYVVDATVITKLFENKRFILVNSGNFNQFSKKQHTQKDQDDDLKKLAEIYNNMDDDMKKITKLYKYYIFKKE
jgi:SAM-dependent methyltransferase